LQRRALPDACTNQNPAHGRSRVLSIVLNTRNRM
jgi:hypothetical protein